MNPHRASIIRLQNSAWYGITMAALALASAVGLIYEFLLPGHQHTIFFLRTADLIIAWIFLTDFTTGLLASPHRSAYFKSNWLNLVSSIPISSEVFRALRILRLSRALRTVRAALNLKQVIKARKNLTHDHT